MNERSQLRSELETTLSPHKPFGSRLFRRQDFVGSGINKHVDCLKAIFAGTSVQCVTRIAENTSMPGSMLEQLAYHPEVAVREAVADNCNTPIDTLWMLVYDQNLDVRYALAENHNLPLALLSALSEDENPYISARAQSTIDRLLGGRVFTGEFWVAPEEAAAV